VGRAVDNAEPYDEIQRLTEIEGITNGKSSHFDMNAAFCARMHAAMALGWKALRLMWSARLELKTRDTSRT
jgi:2-hydroxychromene-2-carboxylate isomerase